MATVVAACTIIILLCHCRHGATTKCLCRSGHAKKKRSQMADYGCFKHDMASLKICIFGQPTSRRWKIMRPVCLYTCIRSVEEDVGTLVLELGSLLTMSAMIFMVFGRLRFFCVISFFATFSFFSYVVQHIVSLRVGQYGYSAGVPIPAIWITFFLVFFVCIHFSLRFSSGFSEAGRYSDFSIFCAMQEQFSIINYSIQVLLEFE